MRDEDRTNVYDFMNARECTCLVKICFHKFDNNIYYMCKIYENIKILMNFNIPDSDISYFVFKKVNRMLGYNSLISKNSIVKNLLL